MNFVDSQILSFSLSPFRVEFARLEHQVCVGLKDLQSSDNCQTKEQLDKFPVIFFCNLLVDLHHLWFVHLDC